MLCSPEVRSAQLINRILQIGLMNQAKVGSALQNSQRSRHCHVSPFCGFAGSFVIEQDQLRIDSLSQGDSVLFAPS